MSQLPFIKKGTYQHFKGAKYQVIDLVRHSETEEWLVLYKPLDKPSGLWVRPIDMFCETVEVAGENIPRFKLLQTSDESV
ncbi:MAG: DUF1653 domain-containing protein [Gammaproteobacteria bacterium]|nr:DUF1653 domain-containing protein [Gammaproteobacteria bacterium]